MGRGFSNRSSGKYQYHTLFQSPLFLCLAVLFCTQHIFPECVSGGVELAQMHMEVGGAWSRKNLFSSQVALSLATAFESRWALPRDRVAPVGTELSSLILGESLARWLRLWLWVS